jgi:hypothetical protein
VAGGLPDLELSLQREGVGTAKFLEVCGTYMGKSRAKQKRKKILGARRQPRHPPPLQQVHLRFFPICILPFLSDLSPLNYGFPM